MNILSVDTVNYWYLTTAHVILRCDEGTHGRYDQLCNVHGAFQSSSHDRNPY